MINLKVFKKISLIAVTLLMGFLSVGRVEAATCSPAIGTKYSAYIGGTADACCINIDLIYSYRNISGVNSFITVEDNLKAGGIGFCPVTQGCIEKEGIDFGSLGADSFLNSVNRINSNIGLSPLAYCTQEDAQKAIEQACKDKRGRLYDVVNGYGSDDFNRGTCCLTEAGEKKINALVGVDSGLATDTSLDSSNQTINAGQPSPLDTFGSLNTTDIPTNPNATLNTNTLKVEGEYTQADLDAVDGPISCAELCEPEGKGVAAEDSEETCQEGYTLDQATCQCKPDCDPETCNCGIKLLTRVPFIGTCIQFANVNTAGDAGSDTTTVNALNAFPLLAGALAKIAMTLLLLLSFASLIAAGVMMTMSGAAGTYDKGKSLIIKVVVAIALLGIVGAVLNAINPNFFLT